MAKANNLNINSIIITLLVNSAEDMHLSSFQFWGMSVEHCDNSANGKTWSSDTNI